MNYRITLDIDQAHESISNWANENTDTYRNGVWGVDSIGVYHMYYGSRSDLIEFKDPEKLK